MSSMWRVAARRSSVALLLLLAVPLLYLLGAVVGGLVPANAGWREADRGVTVFVRSNGIHTDIVMPARVGELDWLAVVPPGDVARPDLAAGWVAIGAGEREFFLNTPRWRDLKLATVGKAAFGGTMLLHVEHRGPPWADADTRRLVLRPAEYRRLWRAIRGHLKPGLDGRPIPLIGRGYGVDDVFYEAVGRYDGLRTCNYWTGRMLAEAGVKVGRWTPLPQGVMWRFRVD